MVIHRARSIAAAGATLVALASILAAAPAPASTAPVEQTSVVSYRDLDLTRPKGVRTLRNRVARAIDRVCGPAPRLEIAERQAYRACWTDAGAGALAQMRRAELAATRGLATASQ